MTSESGVDGLASLLGEEVAARTRLSGGDVATAYRVELASGKTVFAKTFPGAHHHFFATEAAGLRWLAEADAVALPQVVAVGTDPPWLVLDWIEPGRPGGTTDADFGRQLADLHRAGAPSFGRQDRRTTGSRRLPNQPMKSWAKFYATQRLLPLAQLASNDPNRPLSSQTIDQLKTVAAHLQSGTHHQLEPILGPTEPAARLHGDLWAGNRLIGCGGQNWLIDPAAFGGHREFDLAMMDLFGGFGRDCFAAYHQHYPLAPGWQERLSFYQLAPLVVHAIKFGGHYRQAAAQLAARWAAKAQAT